MYALASAFSFAGRRWFDIEVLTTTGKINLFRLNLLSSPACPLPEEVNMDRIILEE